MAMNNVEEVFGPKANAASRLHAATSNMPIVCAAFSSWISVLGSTGQANYVAANAYLNTMALLGRASGRSDSALLLPPVSSGLGMSADLFASTSTQQQRFLQVAGMTLDQAINRLIQPYCDHFLQFLSNLTEIKSM